MHVNDNEITKGLVISLDSSVLRALGGCETNAVIAPEGDRAVAGVHDFLIVGVDATTRMCTAVPLFTKTAVGNQPLEEEKKSGHPEQWIGIDTFYSRWQHWRIPLASVVTASLPDDTTPATRRRYAEQFPTDLDSIRSGERRNRSAYRGV